MSQQSNILSPSFVVLAVVVYYVALWIRSGYRFRANGLRLPPGPKQKFLTGNLHQLPKTEPWLTYTSWANIYGYGSITHIRVFNKRIILLSTAKAVIDLLDFRSALYSDRPIMWMSGELAGAKSTIFQTRYSDPRFKSLRKLLHLGLNARASRTYRPIQIRETQVFLQGLADNPADFREHIRRNAVAVIVKVAYGYHVASTEDEIVGAVDEGLRSHAGISAPGKYWIEFFPLLRYVPDWFPGAGFKHLAKETGRRFFQINQVPFDWARKQIVCPFFLARPWTMDVHESANQPYLKSTGNFVESFVSKHVLGSSRDDLFRDDQYSDDVKWAAAALYVGGGDTTVSALATLFLVMALHPEVQRRAQADIDRVAPNRMLTFDDHESLPYVRAIVKEILRWAPVVPLGLAHRVMEDDVYEDYFIPKGSTVFANIWAITHDEEAYPDPFTFDPSRHLGDSPQPDPLRYVFGFGRRVCPGAHFAELSLFLNVANVLAFFDISKQKDERGLPIDPAITWTTGVIRHPGLFNCSIKPRSESHVTFLS